MVGQEMEDLFHDEPIVFQDEEQAYLKAEREIDIERREIRLARWVGIVVAFVIGAAVLIVLLFVVDPAAPSPAPATPTTPPAFPSSAPVIQSPSVALSDAPTISSNNITVTATYSAIVPFGKANGVTPESVAPDLIASMDLLAPQVLLEFTASSNQAKKRIIAGIAVQLPTSIENLVEVGTYAFYGTIPGSGCSANAICANLTIGFVPQCVPPPPC
jgi:hypothetical protein